MSELYLIKKKAFHSSRKYPTTKNPKLLNKLQVINGDEKDLRLGISDSDYLKVRCFAIIINLAACVRYDDHLRNALLLNTREICEYFLLPREAFAIDCDSRENITFAEWMRIRILRTFPH